MNNATLLLDILLVYMVAILAVVIVKRLKQTPIIGYLVAGVIIGPSALHLGPSTEEVEVLAEIGVIFFLFIVGLEFPMNNMAEMAKKLFGIGGLQVVLSSALFFAGLSSCGYSQETSLFMGILFSLSSTAIVMKLLIERSEQNSLYGQTSLAVLLFQDLMIVPIMILIPILAGNGNESPLWSLFIAIVKATLVISVLFLAARFIFRPLVTFIVRQRSPELFIITILFLCLGTSLATKEAGFSMMLGAFIAGLMLSDTDFKHQTIAELLPFRDSLLPLFFVSVGMLVNIGYFVANIVPVLLFFFFIIIVKSLVLIGILRFSGYPFRALVTTGLALAQVGEFSFILLLQGKLAGIIDESLYQTLISAIVLSMMVTPFMISRATGFSFFLLRFKIVSKLFPAVSLEQIDEKQVHLDDHVIVCGYGLTGRNIVRSLKTFDIPYIALELNWNNVEKGIKEGDNVIFADAGRLEILQAVGIKRARSLVLAINEIDSSLGIIRLAKKQNPNIFIMARTSFVRNLPRLEHAGADLVIPEEFEVSLKIVGELLSKFGFGKGEINMLLQDIRVDHYSLFNKELQENSTKEPLSP